MEFFFEIYANFSGKHVVDASNNRTDDKEAINNEHWLKFFKSKIATVFQKKNPLCSNLTFTFT